MEIRAVSRLWQPKPPYRFKRQVKDASEITLEMWEEMLLFAASLVDEYGVRAQPLFNRLEREFLQKLRLEGTVHDIKCHMATWPKRSRQRQEVKCIGLFSSCWSASLL